MCHLVKTTYTISGNLSLHPTSYPSHQAKLKKNLKLKMGISRVVEGSNKKTQRGKHGCFLEFVIDLEKLFKL